MSDGEMKPRARRMPKPTTSFDELVIALKSLDREDSGLGKYVATFIVGAALAIGAWSVSSLSSVQTTLGMVQVSMDQMVKNTEEMKQDIRSITNQQSDMKADQAQLRQRIEALEKRLPP